MSPLTGLRAARRTSAHQPWFAAIAVALAGALALPIPAIASPVEPAFAVGVTVADFSLALQTAAEPVAVASSGTVDGVLSIEQSLSGGSTSSLAIGLDEVSGPGATIVQIAGVVVGAGGAVSVPASGQVPITVTFDAPGDYLLTLSADATVVVPATGDIPESNTSVSGGPAALSFSVALPESIEEPEAVTEEVPEEASAPTFGTYGVGDSWRPIALTRGHIDLFEVTYDTGIGALGLRVKDDTNLYANGAQYRDPTDVEVFIDSSLTAYDTSSMPAAYDFLKVDGATIYLLPQTQNIGLPWPGWSTERLVGSLPADVALPASGTPVRLAVSVSGPGNVFTWQTGSFGNVQNKYIDTVDPAADVIPISRSAHVHTNWAFTAQGTYDITVTPSATTTTGATITGPGVVYRIHVGPASDAAPVATTEPALAGSGVVGEELSVSTGAWSPTPHGYSYQWLRDGVAIPGATVNTYTPVADDVGHAVAAEVIATIGDGRTPVRTAELEIRDAGGGQEVGLRELGAHYHQGETIRLEVIADPPLGSGDTVSWEWKWPGAEWSALPGASGAESPIIAEQALDGVEVRATVDFAADGVESMTAGPATIHHDDHGVAARQQPTVSGETSYAEGDTVTLAVALPTNGSTLLPDRRWERKVGDGDWTVIDDETGSELTFEATADEHGVQYRVAVVTPTGDVAYGPSPAVTVVVEPASSFAIAGLEESYEVGDVLSVRVVGHTLAAAESYRWAIRPVGADSSGYGFTGTGGEAPQGRIEQIVDAGYDGYEIRVRVRVGSDYTAVSDWMPIRVENAVEPVTTTFPAGDFYLGDDVVFPIAGRSLDEGESLRLAYRFGSPWYPLATTHESGTLVLPATSPIEDADLVLQVAKDGLVTAQSPVFTGTIRQREVLVEGIRGVYRVGQTLQARAEVHPASESLVYRWMILDSETYALQTIQEGSDASALSLELPMTMDLDGTLLYFAAVAHAGSDEEVFAGYWSQALTVSDADPSTQLFFFEGLSGHYHQGYDIALDLVADPAFAEGDTVDWEWAWPGVGWSPMPGASGVSHSLIAEQALDGVQVRATLTYGESGEKLTADPVTIHHDDHGSPARQQPTVGGETAYREGDHVELYRQLPENSPTVLTDHLWERRAADGEWAVLDGETDATLTFEAAADDDGGQYRVSILTPAGEIAYGPSPAVTLEVEATGEPPRWQVANWSLTASGARVLNQGHVDIASLLEDGELVTRIKDTTDEGVDAAGTAPAFWHETEDVVLQAFPDSAITVPLFPGFEFLGTPGDTVWVLPQIQESDLLWPGWSTESIPSSDTQTDFIWTLTDVDGPGDVALYEENAFGVPTVFFDSGDGYPDSMTIGKRVHQHGSWAFSAEGVYCLAFERSTTLASGEQVSVRFDLTFAVGDVDVTAVDPADCASGDGPLPDDETYTEVDDLDPATEIEPGDADGGNIEPGDTVTLDLGETYAGEMVSVWLHSTARWLGWMTVGSGGVLSVALPADTPVGSHHLVVEHDGTDIAWGQFDVVAAASTPSGQNPTYPTQGCIAGSTILSAGHIDYATRIVNGEIQSLIGDDTAGSKVYREPSGVVLWLKPSSAVTLPSGVPQVGPAGQTVWMVPQTQQSDLIWLGWSTEALNAGNARGALTWSLDSVSGPGTVKVFTGGALGGVSMVLNGPGSTTIPLGVHAHANWAFSAEGVYRLAFTQSVTLADGRVSSDTERLTIVVGNVNPASAAGGSGCATVSTALFASENAIAEDVTSTEPDARDDERPEAASSAADPLSALAEGNPVPLLLVILGGLLLVGAAGVGVVSWRRRALEGASGPSA